MEKPRAEKTYRIFKKIALAIYICIGISALWKVPFFPSMHLFPEWIALIIDIIFWATALVGLFIIYYLSIPLAILMLLFIIDDIGEKNGLWKKWLVLAILFFASRYFAYAFYGAV